MKIISNCFCLLLVLCSISFADEGIPGFWSKFQNTYDTGKNFLDNTSRGSGRVNENMGVYSYRWKIPLPPGRKGVEPNLSLVYSSSGRRSPYGEGWKLTVPMIERSTKFGKPTFSDVFSEEGPVPVRADNFIYHDENGDTHYLVPVEAIPDEMSPTEIRYRFLRESDFIWARFHRGTSSYWELLKRNGNVLRFGDISSNAVVQVDGNEFAWYIDKLEDQNGNYMTFTYTTFGHVRVPNTIMYTMRSDLTSIAAPVKIEFHTIAANPKVYDCSPGSCKFIDDRYLDRIDVKVIPIELVDTSSEYFTRNRYQLSYSIIDGHKILDKISLYGGEDLDNDRDDELPEIVFSYYPSLPQNENSWYITIDKPVLGPQAPEWEQQDFNGEDYYVYKKRGLLDINGDGVKDLVFDSQNYPSKTYEVYFGTTNEWGDSYTLGGSVGWDTGDIVEGNLSTSWIKLTSSGQARSSAVTQKLIDMNGDGLPDWVSTHHEGFYVMLNNGSGFDGGEVWKSDDDNFDLTYTYYVYPPDDPDKKISQVEDLLFDINGDGLPDQIKAYGGCENPPCYWSVCLNKGRRLYPESSFDCETVGNWSSYYGYIGFTETEDSYDPEESTYAKLWEYVTLKDMNGDGLPDQVVQHGEEGSWQPIKVYWNTGDGFVETSESEWGPSEPVGVLVEERVLNGDPPPLVVESWNTSESMILDYNGDGLSDRIYFENSTWKAAINDGVSFGTVENITYYNNVHDLAYTHTEDFSHPVYDKTETLSMLMDINGDGRLDYIQGGNQGQWNGNSLVFFVDLGTYRPEFKMASIDNGYGGNVSVSYMPASSTNSSLMPMAKDVVFLKTTEDTIKNKNTSVFYNYENGYFETTADRYTDPGNKEFRGFETVTQKNYDRNLRAITKYAQDIYLSGKVLDKEYKTYTTSDVISYEFSMYDLLQVSSSLWNLPASKMIGSIKSKKDLYEKEQDYTRIGKDVYYGTGHGKVTAVIQWGTCDSDPTCSTRQLHKSRGFAV